MKKLLSIVGPTASGKTDLAVDIASHFHGTLLSADSRQVYQGLDIISGKDLDENSKFRIQNSELFRELESKYTIGYYEFGNNVQIYLLDIVPPTYSFSVNDFLTVVPPVIQFVSQSSAPILVGGTGYYIDALFKGIDTISIPPDEELRKSLERKSLEEVQDILRNEDPERFGKMNESDRKNKRRLVRAIEIAQVKFEIRNPILRFNSGQGFKTNSRSKSDQHSENDKSSKHLKHGFFESNFDVLKIGLTAPRDMIKKRIGERVQKRLEQGALDEAKTLFQHYENLSSGVKTSNGYQQLFEFLAGRMNFDDAVLAWKQSEYYNAKKQETWFKRDTQIHWIDITRPTYKDEAFSLVENWYNELGYRK